MRDMILGLVQMAARPGDIRENLSRMEAFCREGARRRVDLLCFPELSVTGYFPGAAELAQPIPGPASEALAQMACSSGMTLCAGLTEQNEAGPPFLTQILCLPNGRTFRYRKTHLGRRETPLFTPGGSLPVFQTPKVKVGIALCWETHFPEVASALALSGAELLLYPHASPLPVPRRRESWRITLAARSLDCGIYTACCNALGDSGRGFSFSGGAMAFDPRGRLLAEAFSQENHLLVLPLSAALLGDSSQSLPRYLDCRRPDLYR